MDVEEYFGNYNYNLMLFATYFCILSNFMIIGELFDYFKYNKKNEYARDIYLKVIKYDSSNNFLNQLISESRSLNFSFAFMFH